MKWANIKHNIILTLILTILLLTLTSCTVNLDKILSEEFDYQTYSSDGFSIEYPKWPVSADKVDETEISVSKGYCTVIIDSNDVPAENLYDYLISAIEDADHVNSYETFDDELLVISNNTYLEHILISELKIEDCNNQAHTINIACLDEVYQHEKVREIYNHVFDSVSCDVDETSSDDDNENNSNKDTSNEENTNNEGALTDPVTDSEEIIYTTLIEDDFELEYPEWNELNDLEEESILGVSVGTCSVFVNKHNALPEDLYNWIITNFDGTGGYEIIETSEMNNVYEIEYEYPYEEYTLIAKSKMFYCNYVSYMTVAVCIEEHLNEDSEDMQEYVLESAQCLAEYDVPEIEIPQEIVEEEPEVIEEIENEIVKTELAEEFGLNAEAIVYFINGNDFFTNIMADFDTANLVFEDDENARELQLKITLDADGQIIFVEDGLYDDADVTLYLDLMQALNILNNAANINPVNLLVFAADVRTEPEEVKNEVIAKVLRGEYN
jgi:hypothetical protein